MSELRNVIPMEPAENSGYAVIRREDAQAFSREVRELAAALLVLKEEVEALKRDGARQVTVNHQQAKGLGTRIRLRAEALCDKYSLDVRIHGAAFRAAIKKDILSGYAVKDLHDIPLSEWEDCMQRIDAWTSYALVRKRRAVDNGRTD